MDNPRAVKTPRVAPIVLVGLSVLSIGVIFYHQVEHLKWLDSFYFSVITLTTVGYGDIVPTTDAGKLFTSFYVLFGVGILAATANFVVRRAFARQQKRHESRKERREEKRQTK